MRNAREAYGWFIAAFQPKSDSIAETRDGSLDTQP